MNDTVIARLQTLLDEMQGIEQLPPTCSPEAYADHAGWMKRYEQIKDLGQRAMYAALIALPPEVDAVYQQIVKLQWHLFNFGTSEKGQPMNPDETFTQEDTEEVYVIPVPPEDAEDDEDTEIVCALVPLDEALSILSQS